MDNIKKPKEKFGQILARQRRAKRLSLDTLSKKLKIPFKYLEALEYGDFKNFPPGWQKLLKKYCAHLGCDFKVIWQTAKSEQKKMVGINRAVEKNYLMAWPKIIRTAVIILIVAGVLIFLGFKVNQIFSAPTLKIGEPVDNSKTYQKKLKILGKSQKEAEITINNNIIFVDASGNFEALLDLHGGLNLIKITAKKKYSRTREVDLRIILSDEKID
ncbi:MAG: helix-turn-helix domain-containing protein [Candidatus Buchananbacteria bacterium]